jgi:hypothetical protein
VCQVLCVTAPQTPNDGAGGIVGLSALNVEGAFATSWDHSDSFVWRTEVNAPKCSDPFYIKASCTSNNFVTSPLLLDHCAAVEKHHTFIVSCDLAVLAYTACHVGSSFPIQDL